MKFIILVFSFIIEALTGFSQQAAFSDAAQAYNRLLIEKGNGTYMRISNYKVIGTPYLFGGKNRGDLYGKGEFANNIQLSYNTYNNEVEFYSPGNSAKPLVKTVENIDSFVLRYDGSNLISKDLKFISSEVLGVPEKGFYQLMYDGDFFDLYKKYKSTLGIVTTNYIQSELRQFDLSFEYFYFSTATSEMKKIKLSSNFLKREFKSVNHISEILASKNLAVNHESILNEIFISLNSNK